MPIAIQSDGESASRRDSLAGRPSSGSRWVKPPSRGAERQIGSSSRPSTCGTPISTVARTAAPMAGGGARSKPPRAVVLAASWVCAADCENAPSASANAAAIALFIGKLIQLKVKRALRVYGRP